MKKHGIYQGCILPGLDEHYSLLLLLISGSGPNGFEWALYAMWW